MPLVRLVVPYPAGGTTDQVARILLDPLRSRWGSALVIDNRPGASGTLGTLHVARSAPDGLTLCIGTISTLVLLPRLRETHYHPLHSFDPLGGIGEAPFIVVASPELPVKDLRSLVTLLRQHPGKFNYATVGEGSLPHWAAQRFEQASGTQLTHIPYQGASRATLDLMAGRVHLMFDQLATFSGSSLRAGTLKPLAVMADRRMPQLPGVPTVAEAGFSGVTASMWMGLLAPIGLDAAHAEKLSHDLGEVLREPTVQTALQDLGIEPRASGRAAFREFLKSQWASAGPAQAARSNDAASIKR